MTLITLFLLKWRFQTVYTCKHAFSFVLHYKEAPDPCLPNPCENDGNCQRVGTGQDYECRCNAGFTGDHCENGEPITINKCIELTLIELDLCFRKSGP